MTLGQRIQDLRKQAGLSQEALGEALGVSRQAVSKWEGDNGIPELDTLIAMSRLFGITVGQLLGVETPEEKGTEATTEAAPGFTEEQVEAILRRYAEESRRQEPEEKQRYPIGSWIIAGCAAVAAVIMLVLAVGKLRGVASTISDLQSQISVLHSNLSSVRNQVSGLSDELRGVLEEQNSLISSFEYEVLSFDIEKETVELKLTATLKTYTAGSKLQFVLDWIKTDQTTGELTCDPVEGPKFETVVTVPMNFHMEIDVLIIDGDGTIHEQPVDVIYSGMHPDNFSLNASTPILGVSTHPNGVTQFTYEVDVYTDWPDLIYPVQAYIIVCVDGEEFIRQKETLENTDHGEYTFSGEINFDEPMNQDLDFYILLIDNYGRQTEERVFGHGVAH